MVVDINTHEGDALQQEMQEIHMYYFAQRDAALWQAWQGLQASADDILQKGAAHFFTCIRQAVCDKLALDTLTSARLGQRDEGVYNHLVCLMQTYRDVVHLFENQSSDPAPDLVAGLCDVLNSRLRQFEDVATGGRNPIAEEKRAILEKAVLHTTAQIESLEKAYMVEALGPAFRDYGSVNDTPLGQPEEELRSSEKLQSQPYTSCDNQLIIDTLRNLILTNDAGAAWKALRESIIQSTFPALHTHYQENHHRCLASIDDLHNRKTASYYADLLEREWEVLGLIIQVQVKAIEAASHSTEAPILSKLREAYQQTGPVVSGFRKLMQSAPQSADTGITPEMLAQSMANPPAAELDIHALQHALSIESGVMLTVVREKHLKTVRGLIGVSGEELLADKIINVFENAQSSLATLLLHINNAPPGETTEMGQVKADKGETNTTENTETEYAALHVSCTNCTAPTAADTGIAAADATNNTDNAAPIAAITDAPASSATNMEGPTIPVNTPPTPENEILTGIAETLEIKVDSLKESLEYFKETGDKLAKDLHNGMLPMPEEDYETAKNQLLEAWCTTPPNQDTIKDFLQGQYSQGIPKAHDEKYSKVISQSIEKSDKAILRFRKETLLYEISTYEEILFYSVSRLRESTLPHIISAVETLDEAFAALETILADADITVIRPAPHEPFNGREHEVLTAEEQEGFAKGEIIKTMTSGYKSKDQVILRANVIAAR